MFRGNEAITENGVAHNTVRCSARLTPAHREVNIPGNRFTVYAQSALHLVFAGPARARVRWAYVNTFRALRILS
jgi:hypothetical protein